MLTVWWWAKKNEQAHVFGMWEKRQTRSTPNEERNRIYLCLSLAALFTVTSCPHLWMVRCHRRACIMARTFINGGPRATGMERLAQGQLQPAAGTGTARGQPGPTAELGALPGAGGVGQPPARVWLKGRGQDSRGERWAKEGRRRCRPLDQLLRIS